MRNWSCLALSSGPRSKNSAPSTFSYHSLVRSRLLIWILMCWINVTLDITAPPATEFVQAGCPDHDGHHYTAVGEHSDSVPAEGTGLSASDTSPVVSVQPYGLPAL